MTLYLFTSTYPYGNAESFLEDEIHYLCDVFEKVEVIPFLGNQDLVRLVPQNCIVHAPICEKRGIQKLINGLYNKDTFLIYWKDFCKKRVFLNGSRLKTWLISYINANILLNSDVVKRIFSSVDKHDVCYSYWGKCANILSVVYHGRARFVSRYHGEWDLWEESSGNYAPIREKETFCLNYALFISKKGEDYFKAKYPHCKSAVFPLGSKDYGVCMEERDNSVLKIVSCSTVYPLKRVDLIFDALNSFDGRKIEWTHLGGGPNFEELSAKVRTECNPHLTVNLVGMVSHNQVMNCYKEHQFNIFINLSTNEGVPVSIMEATSFGIPIIATDVGGTSEIVQSSVGILLSSNPTIEEICRTIKDIKDRTFSPRDFWQNHYFAEVNYKKFAHFLTSL